MEYTQTNKEVVQVSCYAYIPNKYRFVIDISSTQQTCIATALAGLGQKQDMVSPDTKSGMN